MYHVNKLNIIFLPIYEVKEFFNIASLIENCLTCPCIPHTYATTIIYHEKVYRVVFNFQEKVATISCKFYQVIQNFSSSYLKNTNKCITKYTTLSPFLNLKDLIL